MGWQIRFSEDKVARLDDLPPETFDKLAADDDTDVSWYGVYRSPGASGARFYRVVSACAAFLDIDPPAAPATMRDAEKLLEMLEETTDISEQPMVNDFPPTPAAPESGSTSGALGDSDGLSTSPEPTALASS